MVDSNVNGVDARKIIFSLDIGTKSVIGVILIREEDEFKIIDVEMIPHTSRAMYDGQIHDIDKVVQVAKRVKENLEKRLKIKLTKVAIAAAGRALKTSRVKIDQTIDYTKEIHENIIHGLEMDGVFKAQKSLEEKMHQKDAKYYCVGHTVIDYFIDHYPITSLKGHRANEIGADILVTFLPQVVVDSLYAVMHEIGLKVEYLTLEPIAAIHVAIPHKLRLLNLALVDIGAGTSDIAITKDGNVISYAMVSVAGDEITEALAQKFLLDFNTAEAIKMQLSQQDKHTFKDIVGISYTLTTEEILENIQDAIDNLCKEIGQKILEYNKNTPSAIFCIGGGSQIPMLTKYLAKHLGLREERVVVRGTEIIENISFKCNALKGPEFITPIGIGCISFKDHKENFLNVQVNHESVRLLQSKKLLVSDAFIKAGITAKKIISRKGKDLKFKVNGRDRVILGTLGVCAKVYVNHKLASLDVEIKDKDYIKLEEGVDGIDAKYSLQAFIEEMGRVKFNGVDVSLMYDLTVNDEIKSLEYNLCDGDEIKYHKIQTIEGLMKRLDMNDEEYVFFIKDKEVFKDHYLKAKDEIRTYKKESLPQQSIEKEKGVHEEEICVFINGKPIWIPKKEAETIFVEIFEYFEFDRTKVRGKLMLTLNGKKANYTDPIHHNDEIQVYWQS